MAGGARGGRWGDAAGLRSGVQAGVLRPMSEVETLIAKLGLAPLAGEGGWFHRFYLSAECDATGRPQASAIHYLMSAENFSALHRMSTPEHWRWCDGAAIELLVLGPAPAAGRVVVLGPEAAAGEVRAWTVPGGAWQGARPRGAWALAECRMEPAWDERDYAIGGRAELQAEFPDWAEWVGRLTR